EQMVLAESASRGERLVQLQIELDQASAAKAASYELVRKALEELGEIVLIQPESATDDLKMIAAAMVSEAEPQTIVQRGRIPNAVSGVRVVPYGAERGQDPLATAGETRALHETTAGGMPALRNAENTLRVEAERIDTVLNLVGELIIGKSMLHQSLSEFDRRFPKDALRARFSDAMAFQARVLTDLQKSVMKIRMVPVEQLFRRFPRQVRDVAKMRG